MRSNTREKRGTRRKRRRRFGGFLRSRQTKYNSTSYKEGSRQDEGSLTLSLSLSPAYPLPPPPCPPPFPPLALRRSLTLLSLSPIAKKTEGRERGCTLLKHEWITKSRVHSFAPWRPRNPQKVYLFTTNSAVVYGRGLGRLSLSLSIFHPIRHPPHAILHLADHVHVAIRESRDSRIYPSDSNERKIRTNPL